MDGRLSAREVEILQLVAQGLSNREIAKILNLSTKTVEHLLGASDSHRGIYPKINVTNRTEAAVWYVANFGPATHHLAAEKFHKQMVEVYSDYQSQITQLRNNGQPRLAISMADFLIAKSQEAASQAPSEAYRQIYLNLAAQALIDKSTAYLETVPRNKMVQSIKPLMQNLKWVGKELDDSNYVAMANVLLAGAYNIQREYEAGRKIDLAAYEQTTSVDLKLRILRGVAISSIYLHDPESVQRVMPLAKELLAGEHFTKVEQVCETYEGMGRAYGLMGSAEAFKWFEQAEQILHTLNHPPFRTLQLLLSKQEVMMHLEVNAVTEIERLGREAIELAERHGYERHKTAALKNLQKSLDR